MPGINEILEFNISKSTLKLAGEKIVPTALISLRDLRIEKLKRLTQDIGASSYKFDGNDLIPQVFNKFKSAFLNNDTNFIKRELRTLSYTLSYSESGKESILSSEKELTYAIKLLTADWRDSFLMGMIDCYLQNWDSENRMNLKIIGDFIFEKVKSYDGNRASIKGFKANIKYFDLKIGDIVLGSEIALKNISISDAPRFLSLPDSWFKYPYFSKVIVAYFEKNKNDLTNKINDLDSAIEKHNNSGTNKRILSQIIIQANKPEHAIVQDKVKELALKFIGDPENKAQWADIKNANDKEKSELILARTILNEWITRQFINVFFKVCINDERRKKFWLKLAPKISSFQVYGPALTKSILKRDKRISSYLDNRFKIVDSNKDISAFVLYTKDYMLIEFSDAGYAFYAYNINGSNQPNLKYRLNSVDDLRNGNMPMLAYRSGSYITKTNKEGRLSHNDGDLRWEDVFNYWLKNIAKIEF
jgi:hypothetical protein